MYTACNKEDKGLSNKKTITALKCAFPSTQSPSTKTQYIFEDKTLKVSWSPGDEIAVSDGKSLFKFKQTGDITDNGHTAMFTCENPVNFEGDSIIAVYPYTDSLSFDISKQTGNLEDIFQSDIYLAKAKIHKDNEVESLLFRPLCAIARFPKDTYVSSMDSTGLMELNFIDCNNGIFANKLAISKKDGINANFYTKEEDRILVNDYGYVSKTISIPVSVESGRLLNDYFLCFIPNTDNQSNYKKTVVVTDKTFSFSIPGNLSPNNIYSFSSFKYLDVKEKSISVSKDKQTVSLTVLTNRDCQISVSSSLWMKCKTPTITPSNSDVSLFNAIVEIDKNNDYYSRKGYIYVKGINTKSIRVTQDAEPIPEGSAEVQIHYMEPISNVNANAINAVCVNDVHYDPYNDSNSSTLYVYGGLPKQYVGQYIVTKAGLSNIKFYRNGIVIYDKDINLKIGKQNLVVYDLQKVPILIDNEYPYWSDNSTKDSLYKINFANFLFETETVPYAGKLQYQANRQGEDTWENVGKPIAFGESTGLQTIRLHLSDENNSQRINYRILTEDGNILQCVNSKGDIISYSDYWNAYQGRAYIHFFRGIRTIKSPMAAVSQWTLVE